MTKVTVMGMRNVEGGAKCPGCGKSKIFGTLWAHKLFCKDYKAMKATKALNKMWG